MGQHAEKAPHEGTHVRLYRQGDPEARERIPHYLSIAVINPGGKPDPDLPFPKTARMSFRTGWVDRDLEALGRTLGCGPMPVYLTLDQVADLARACMNVLADLPGDPAMSANVRVAGRGVRCDDEEIQLFLGASPAGDKGEGADR